MEKKNKKTAQCLKTGGKQYKTKKQQWLKTEVNPEETGSQSMMETDMFVVLL